MIQKKRNFAEIGSSKLYENELGSVGDSYLPKHGGKLVSTVYSEISPMLGHMGVLDQDALIVSQNIPEFFGESGSINIKGENPKYLINGIPSVKDYEMFRIFKNELTLNTATNTSLQHNDPGTFIINWDIVGPPRSGIHTITTSSDGETILPVVQYETLEIDGDGIQHASVKISCFNLSGASQNASFNAHINYY